MPDYSPRELSCLLFKNDRGKAQNANAPDWTGELLINGRAHSAAMWTKQGQRGEYFSLSLKLKEQQKAPSAHQSAPKTYAPRGPVTNGPSNEPELPIQSAEAPEEDVPF